MRKAAQQLGIHRNTSFRWRHRFLALAKTDRPRCLHGIAEADEMYLLESKKGARHLQRSARRRGSHARQAVNLRAGIRVRGAAHVQNVNAYHSRLRRWLSIFHGVATRYLPNYLGWRWVLDARRILSAETLLKATLGEFPHLTVT